MIMRKKEKLTSVNGENRLKQKWKRGLNYKRNRKQRSYNMKEKEEVNLIIDQLIINLDISLKETLHFNNKEIIHNKDNKIYQVFFKVRINNQNLISLKISFHH